MSVEYCEFCHKHIDIDFDTEHFAYDENNGCYVLDSKRRKLCVEQEDYIDEEQFPQRKKFFNNQEPK